MNSAKLSTIFHAIFTALVIVVVVYTLVDNTLPSIVGNFFSSAYKVQSDEVLWAYGRIYILATAACIPMIVIPIGMLYSYRDFYKFIYAILQIGVLIAFYNLAAPSFATLPIAEGSETEIILGIVPVFGQVKDFFTNLINVYSWYALPFFLGLLNFWFLNGIYLKDFRGNLAVRFIVYLIVLGLVNFLAFPILMVILAAIGGFFAGLIGAIFIVILISILFSMFNSPTYTARVTDRYGNTHKIDFYE